ncbi:T9SS type B sorting domain-containing protein [Chitinophaga lutea]
MQTPLVANLRKLWIRCGTPVALFLLLLNGLPANGQQCSGSLGDPVFKETFGDAGTTVKPTLGPPLPAGITTYTYYSPQTISKPVGPYPGQYAISNTTRGYNNTYFVDRRDHTSTNGTGYCMVVDANATPDKFYERTITGLCAGTVFEFSAWIMNINPQSGVSQPSLRFDIMDANNPNGTPIASVSTGTVAYNGGNWVRQAGIFQMPSTTSSVILRIFSNTPSSQGNDLALDDIAFAACGPTITFTQAPGVVCRGGTTTLNVSLPAGSYSRYYFQLQKRLVGASVWDNEGSIISQTSNTYVFTVNNAQGGYEYRVLAAGGVAEINNVNCRVTSNPVNLNVVDYTAVVNGPQRLCYNLPVQLTASIVPVGTGTPTTGFTYQWERSTDGANWTVIPGQTGATMQTNTGLRQDTWFRVIASVSGCNGNGYSQPLKITVEPDITASFQQTGEICEGTQVITLPYTITSGNPDRYTVLAPSMPGFTPIIDAQLTASPLRFVLPANVPPGLYSGTMALTNAASGCGSEPYPIALLIYAQPTASNAGPAQTLCNVTSATLAGNTPTEGTGTWSQASGPNTAAIQNVNDPNTQISGLVPGTYVFRWTIGNGVCTPSSSTVNVTVTPAVTTAQAGPDVTQYNSGSFQLNANTPGEGTGAWSVISGSATLADPANPRTTATIAVGTSATLVWTISNSICPPSSDTVVITYTSQADIRITKAVLQAGPYLAGQEITYEIVVTNAGPSDAPEVRLLDALPAGFTVGDITAVSTGSARVLQNHSSGNVVDGTGSIPADGVSSITVHVSGKINADFEGDLTNTARANPLTVPDPDGAVATVTIPVTRRPYFNITKTAPSTAVAGQQISFVINVENTGLGDAVNTVITDQIPTTVTNVSWTAAAAGRASIVSGASGTGSNISVTANIGGSAAGRIAITVNGTIASDATGTIRNTATATPSEPSVQPFPSNETSTRLTSSPGLVLTKVQTSRIFPTAGSKIQYTITLLNNGPSDAAGTVITDVVPSTISQVTWQATAQGGASITSANTGTGNNISLTGNIPAGSNNNIIIQVSGVIDPNFSGQLINTATATPAEPGVPAVSDDDVSIITKAVALTIKKSCPATAVAGEQISYVLDVTNNGPSNASAASISDVLPPTLSNVSWTAAPLSGNASIVQGASGTGNNINITANIDAGATVRVIATATVIPSAAGIIPNTASAMPSEPNMRPAVSDTCKTLITQKAALRVTKNGPDQAQAGDTIVYTLTIVNAGPSNATSAMITDAVPAEIQMVSWTATALGNSLITSGANGTGNNVNVSANIGVGPANAITVTITGAVAPSFSGSITNRAVATPSEPGSTGGSAEKITSVSRAPRLSVTKSAPDQIQSGGLLAFHIMVENIGEADAVNAVISDVVPASMSNVTWVAVPSGSATISGPASGTGNNISLTASIPAGAANKIQVTVSGTVSPALDSTVTNTAVVTPSEPVPPVSDSKTVTVLRQPKISVVKSGPAALSSGDLISYKIVVTNTSTSDAVHLVIEDPIPGPVTQVSWTTAVNGNATVTAGATGTGSAVHVEANIGGNGQEVIINVTGKVDPSFTGTFENTATAVPSEPGTTASVSNPVLTTVSRKPNLSIVKSGPVEASAGETITYLLTVTNSGPSNALGAVITDTLPALLQTPVWIATGTGGAVIGSGMTGVGHNVRVAADVPAGTGTITVTISGRIPSATTVDSIVNVAKVQPSEPGVAPSFSQEKVTHIRRQPNVYISKIAPSAVFAGEIIQYVIRANNYGPSSTLSTIIKDTIPAEIENPTWTVTASGDATITGATGGTGAIIQTDVHIPPAANDFITITVTGTVNANFTGRITNRVYAVPAEDAALGDTSTAITDVTRYAKLSIQKSGPASVTPGSQVTYSLLAISSGPSTANNITILDTVPAALTNVQWTAIGGNGATVTSGSSGTGNIVRVTGDIPNQAYARITVVITGTLDPNYILPALTNTAIGQNDPTLNVPQSDTATFTSEVHRVANLRITKIGPANGSAGSPISYKLQIRNDGPTNVRNAVISDLVPTTVLNVTWSATGNGGVHNITPASGNNNNVSLTADIEAGTGLLEVTIDGIVSPASINNSTIINTATVALPPGSTATDPNPSDNTSGITTVIDNDPVVRIAKSGPAVVNVLDTVNYTVVVTNGGSGNITNALIEDDQPAGIDFISWTVAATGTASVTGATSGTGNLSTTGDIPVGNNSIVLQITGVINTSAGTTVRNTAEVTAGSHKESSVTTTVNRSTDVSIVKSGPQTGVAGQPISYTLQIFNAGPSNVNDMVITDVLPADMVNVTWSAIVTGNGSVLDSMRIDSSGNISLPAKLDAGPGNYIAIQISGTIAGGANAGTITNTAQVTVNGVTDYNPANNTSSINTAVSREVNLKLRKSGPATASAGSIISYNVEVSNLGPSDAKGVVISDVVPPEIIGTLWTVGVTGSPSITGPFSGTGNNVQTTADIPAGRGNTVSIMIAGMVDRNFKGTISNAAEAGSPDIPYVHDTIRTAVAAESALGLRKSGPTSVPAGAPVSYIITATNNGPSNANGLVITDTIDARIANVTWTTTAVNGAAVTSGATGGPGPIRVVADIPANDTAAVAVVVSGTVLPDASGTLRNTATITSPDSLTHPVVTPPVLTEITQQPLLAAVKNAPSALHAGEMIRYVLQISSNGFSNASNVSIMDTIPPMISQATWRVQDTLAGASIKSAASGAGSIVSILADMPSGSTILVEVSGKVDSTFSGNILNRVVAQTAAPDATPAVSEANTVVTLRPDLQITKSGAAQWVAGQPVTYNIRVVNDGPSAAKNALISDQVENVIQNVTWQAIATGQAAIVSGAAGSGNAVEVRADIPPGAANAINLVVTGTLSPTYFDSLHNIAMVTATETKQTDTARTDASVIARPGIVIQKAGPDTLRAGGSVRYAITITNSGPSAATQFTIRDVVPSTIEVQSWIALARGQAHVDVSAGNTNSILIPASIEPGTGNGISIVVIGRVRPDATGTITNTAEAITGSDTLRASTTGTVIRVADLHVNKTGPALMIRGGKATYVITMRNFGPSDATGVHVRDTVPSILGNTTWTTTAIGSSTITAGASGSGNLVDVTANMPTADSSGVQVVITGDVNPAAPDGTVRNTAYADTVASPPVISTVGSSADVSIVKSIPLTDPRDVRQTAQIAYIGNTIRYLLEIENKGVSAAPNTVATDTLPSGLGQPSASVQTTTGGAAGATASIANGRLNMQIATFPAGGKVVILLTGIATTAGELRNVATVRTAAGITDPDTTNNLSFVTQQVLPKAPLVISKYVSPATGVVGQPVTYTLEITNNGTFDVNPVTVTDTLPPATMSGPPTFTAPPRGSASYNAATGILTWNAGLLQPGETIRWSYQTTVLSPGTLRNAALIAGPDDLSISDTAVVVIKTDKYVNLRITKALTTPTPISAGTVLEYTLTVLNQGPDDGTDIQVRDVLPAGLSQPVTISDGGVYDAATRTITWQLPALANAATRVVRFTAKLISGPAISNTGTVAGKETDPDMTDNTSTIGPVPVEGDDLYIPNIITPNGDGKNDYFVIGGLEKYPGSMLTIYNRWGNQVYQNKDYNNRWDGNGLNESTYYYVLTIRDQQGQAREYKGWIMLSR